MAADLSAYRIVHHALNRPLLVVTGQRGSLCCGYLSMDALAKNGDAAAIVSGVDSPEAMLTATIRSVTPAAEALGVRSGMTGEEALERFGGLAA